MVQGSKVRLQPGGVIKLLHDVEQVQACAQWASGGGSVAPSRPYTPRASPGHQPPAQGARRGAHLGHQVVGTTFDTLGVAPAETEELTGVGAGGIGVLVVAVQVEGVLGHGGGWTWRVRLTLPLQR